MSFTGGNLPGLDEAIKKLNQMIDNTGKATAKGLTDAGMNILGTAVERAPVDKGPLRESGYLYVGDEFIAGGSENGGTYFAGRACDYAESAIVEFAEPYAKIQHEHVEFNHPKGGQAKYLESAVNSEQGSVLRSISERYEELLKGGGD